MPNQVTLTFAGETKDVEGAFDRVGRGAKNMGDKVGGAAKAFEEHGNGMGRLGEKADGAESKLIGVHDVVDGTATIMQGPGKQGMVAYIQGWADLAGGMAPLLLGLAETKAGMMAHVVWSGIVKGANLAWAATQWVLNSALFASPITWIIVGILALILAIGLIKEHTDVFVKAWRASWKWIKDAASDVWDWIKKIPGWVGGAFSKIASAVSRPFKDGFNAISDAWNNTVGRLSWTVPSWIPVIGGNSISVPNLPKFHAGGLVPGAPGQNVMALLQAGETVSSVAGGGGTRTARLEVAGDRDVAAFVRRIIKEFNLIEA